MKEITPETLATFFSKPPAIRDIERQAGIAQGYLNRIMKKEKPLTEETIKKLRPVLEKYNF